MVNLVRLRLRSALNPILCCLSNFPLGWHAAPGWGGGPQKKFIVLTKVSSGRRFMKVWARRLSACVDKTWKCGSSFSIQLKVKQAKVSTLTLNSQEEILNFMLKGYGRRRQLQYKEYYVKILNLYKILR